MMKDDIFTFGGHLEVLRRMSFNGTFVAETQKNAYKRTDFNKIICFFDILAVTLHPLWACQKRKGGRCASLIVR
jgi:hypothetical protein